MFTCCVLETSVVWHSAPLVCRVRLQRPPSTQLTVSFQSQTSPTFSQLTSCACSALPAQYLWSSSLLCYRPDGLELSTRRSPRPGSQQLTSSVCTTLPAQYLWSSSLLCYRLNGLELSTRRSPRPSSQQQQLQAAAADGLLLLMSMLSAVLCVHHVNVPLTLK